MPTPDIADTYPYHFCLQVLVLRQTPDSSTALKIVCVGDWLGRRAETLEGIKKGDTVIVVAPGVRAEWASCEQRFKDNKVGEGN